MKRIMLLLVSAGLALFALSCSNEGGTDDTSDTDTDSDADSDTFIQADTCLTLHLDLHTGSGQQFVDLATMTVTGEDTTDYDFAMVNQMPEPPAIYLGPDATAVNVGSDWPFEGPLEAPADGYMADGDTAVIGTDWQVGGTGQAGYEMSNDIYVIKTADGTYGKIIVTYAMQGQIQIDAFYQNNGTEDLGCAYAE